VIKEIQNCGIINRWNLRGPISTRSSVYHEGSRKIRGVNTARSEKIFSVLGRESACEGLQVRQIRWEYPEGGIEVTPKNGERVTQEGCRARGSRN